MTHRWNSDSLPIEATPYEVEEERPRNVDIARWALDPASANSFYGILIGFAVSFVPVGVVLAYFYESFFGWLMLVLAGPMLVSGMSGQRMLNRRLREEFDLPASYKRIQYGVPVAENGNQQNGSLYIGTDDGFKKLRANVGAHMTQVGEWARAVLLREASFSRDSAKSYDVPQRVFVPIQEFFASQGWAVKSDPSVQNSPWVLTEVGIAKLGIFAQWANPPTEGNVNI